MFALSIVGCTVNDRNVDNENAQSPTTETVLDEDNSEMFPDTKTFELNGAEENSILAKAVNNATQLTGIVNMVTPHYRFSIGDETYYLWISEDSGSIMNIKDTHTLYSLPRNSVREINEFINKNND